MPKAAPFDAHWSRYEAWFRKHAAAYLSELLALRAFVPWSRQGFGIGVGSGRFAAPLGIRFGIDPSPWMLALAAARGIAVVQGVAEALPFAPASFDHALVVTTICFVDSPDGSTPVADSRARIRTRASGRESRHSLCGIQRRLVPNGRY